MICDDKEPTPDDNGQTDLNSHANMPVVGTNAFVLAETGHTAEVNAFSPDFDPIDLKIVDAAIRYDCRHTGKSYMLVIRNALHVPMMQHNLIPPFVMREAGIKVLDIPKIQIDEPTVSNHAIKFAETGFRIPLGLWGVFSYFPLSKPTVEFLCDCDDVYLLTPTNWDPHWIDYSQHEDGMMDWEGNVTSKSKTSLILSDIPDPSPSIPVMQVLAVETARMDLVLDEQNDEIDPVQPTFC